MRPAFHPELVNGPFEDPLLFVRFSFAKRALLFDLGDLHGLSPRDLLKISHVFVTHTHMDHFVGFDTLLRVLLGRERPLHLFGPPGFLNNVEGKLAAYTWNLLAEGGYHLRIEATEVHKDSALRQVYRCQDRFRAVSPREEIPFNGTLLEESPFSVRAILLDHKTPCLAFLLEEKYHINIMKDRMSALGLMPGPWLRSFKQALYDERDPEEDFEVVWEGKTKKMARTFSLGALAEKIVRISPGQKIAYVVDVLYSPDNARKIATFARHADHLFIEAAFLDVHADVARRKCHLTAKQAGTLAREAGVRNITPMHFSPRYENTGHLLMEEALRAFKDPGGAASNP